MNVSVRGALCLWHVFEKLTDGDAEVGTKSVGSLQINSSSGLVVQKRDGVAMKSGFTRDIGNLELAFPHQSGEMALDQLNPQSKKVIQNVKLA
jgi:hypothetical protein